VAYTRVWRTVQYVWRTCILCNSVYFYFIFISLYELGGCFVPVTLGICDWDSVRAGGRQMGGGGRDGRMGRIGQIKGNKSK